MSSTAVGLNVKEGSTTSFTCSRLEQITFNPFKVASINGNPKLSFNEGKY